MRRIHRGLFLNFVSVLAIVLALGSVCSAWASSELDRKYRLETIGLLRSWDNVDGLFADYVESAYQNYFSQQSRFRLRDISQSDSLFQRSEIPYRKIIQDKEILAALARKFKVESMIRTSIYKEGPRYRFVVEWLHSPKMEILSSAIFTIREPENGLALGDAMIQKRLESVLEELIKKVPFEGHVSGVTEEWVTVNIGENVELKKGDTLVLSTIDEVKKHPLLHSIVDWRMRETGRVIVDEVDQKIAFCKILQEEKGRKIARYQKIVKILLAPQSPAENELQIEQEVQEGKRDLLFKKPQYGWVSGSLLLGTSSREIGSGTTGKTGSGLLIGAKAEGQLWLTRQFFVDSAFTFGSFSYGIKDIGSTSSTTSTSVSASMTQFLLALGYNYLLERDLFGTRGWARIGFRSTSYSMATSTTNLTTPTSFTGIVFLGLGGELPIRGPWGALFNFDFGLFRSFSESTQISGSTDGSSDVSFFIGGYYRLNPRMTLKMGVGLLSNTGDFTSGSSVNHKTWLFSPSLVYYF